MKNDRLLKRSVAMLIGAVVLVATVFMSLEASGASVTVNGAAVKYNRLQFIYLTETTGDTTKIQWELWSSRTAVVGTVKRGAAAVVKINNQTTHDTTVNYDVGQGGGRLLYGTQYVARTNGAAKAVPFYASVNLTGTNVGSTITVSGTINLPAYETGTTSISAAVDWIDNSNAAGARPENVEVTLYRNGEAYRTAEVSVKENQAVFTQLPRAYGGKNYVYTVEGMPVADYLVSEPSSGEIIYTYARVPELGFRPGFAI